MENDEIFNYVISDAIEESSILMLPDDVVSAMRVFESAANRMFWAMAVVFFPQIMLGTLWPHFVPFMRKWIKNATLQFEAAEEGLKLTCELARRENRVGHIKILEVPKK